MKIRTSANLFLVTTLLITVCGALAFSVIQVKSYIENNFYKTVPAMLDAFGKFSKRLVFDRLV